MIAEKVRNDSAGSRGRLLTVSAALAARRSVRAFLDTPVDSLLVRDILRRAARSPSGGNLQPWVARVIEGEELITLKALMKRRHAEAPGGEPMAYKFYPGDLKPAYRARRERNGEILYGALGIDRKDAAARRVWIGENFQFFGAPIGVFLFLERNFYQSQWLDLGIYLQSVLLLLQEAGLDSCAQADWAMFEPTVMDYLDSPPDLTLVCGIAIGHGDFDRPENRIVTERDDPMASYDIR